MSKMQPEGLVAAIRAIQADLVVSGPEELAGRYPGEHPDNFGAGVMVQPAATSDAAALIGWAAQYKIAIVPQGGRSGLVGGNISRPGEIILSTARLNAIEAIHRGERTAVVGAGVTLEALQKAAASHGLVPGIDLAARGTATIGGMVSTNAGGILAFRNGVMRHQVLGLEAVLPDGDVFCDMTRVVKVSAGPDIKQLFIGAEGAFGFVTRVVMKLEALRTERATALIGLDDAAAALEVVAKFASRADVQLEGSELMWARFFADSCMAHGFDSGFLEPGTRAILLLELSAETGEAAGEALEEGLEALWEPLGLKGAIVARSLQQSRKFWQLREVSDFIYRSEPGAPSFDVSVPPSLLDRYVEDLGRRLDKIDGELSAYVYGHIADGNLHITITGAEAAAGKQAIEGAVYEGVNAAGGSFSAEHGVGSEKRQAWLTFTDAKKQQLAHLLKSTLDPEGRFNPGKVPF